jgi:hypothetical protein
MKTYQITFIKNSVKYRTEVDADSEFYARNKLLDKWGRECIIIKCILLKSKLPPEFDKIFGRFR